MANLTRIRLPKVNYTHALNKLLNHDAASQRKTTFFTWFSNKFKSDKTFDMFTGKRRKMPNGVCFSPFDVTLTLVLSLSNMLIVLMCNTTNCLGN